MSHCEQADLQSTPLNSRHRALGALMAPFGGWDMPIQYEGILAEHRWCREQAALFDICHMGEFLFKGDIVASGLDDLLTVKVSTIPQGRSRYGFLLNERGGVIDDLIAFRIAEDTVLLVVNAATSPNDFKVISTRLHGGTLIDRSSELAKLDIQGPKSRDVLIKLLGDWVLDLKYFQFVERTIDGHEVVVSRTGYTGELGYELFVPVAMVGDLWDSLLADERVRPAGLGARDVLRLEVGYSLYGNDLDEQTTPLEAGLPMFVDMEKTFVGKEALCAQEQSGIPRRKVAFQVTSRRTPRHGYRIFVDGRDVGEVTSGVFSPMLGCGIGIGLVEPGFEAIGSRLTICHERTSMEALVCTTPFYTEGTVRS